METPDFEPLETEPVIAKIKSVLKDLVGLPPGDGTPHGATGRTKPESAPHGTLTSADAEGLPPHAGTGIVVEE